MVNVSVIGGTGYAGSAIVRGAAARGHSVTVLSRTAPSDPVEGVRYVQGSAAEDAVAVVEGADVLVAAVSPRKENAGTLVELYRGIWERAREAGVRTIVIGGFGSLRPAPDAPRYAEGDGMPAHVLPEAREMLAVLTALQETPADLDWLFVSPAQQFGSRREPGPVRGAYRVGGEVALFDENGTSVIEGEDFALAVVDEIENPAHRREQIGLAY